VSRHGARQAVAPARSAERPGVPYVTGRPQAEAVFFPNLSVLENFGILGFTDEARDLASSTAKRVTEGLFTEHRLEAFRSGWAVGAPRSTR